MNTNVSYLFNEIMKMCRLLVNYDKSYFNAPANAEEINRCQTAFNIQLPAELAQMYMISNGFQIIGNTAKIYCLHEIGCKYPDVPTDYVVFGEMVGDGEKICFNEKTGEIAVIFNKRIFRYSIVGFLEYCIDQCRDGIYMSHIDVEACNVLDKEICETIRKVSALKSVSIGDMADKLLEYSDDAKESIMFSFPVTIRSAMYSCLEVGKREQFVNYLKKTNPIKADNFIRGLKRRAINNIFNRERSLLDDGNAAYSWKISQIRGIYNFNDEGMKYVNASIPCIYDSYDRVIMDSFVNRANCRVIFERKIDIDYLYDVYDNVQYAGNVNNIKLGL